MSNKKSLLDKLYERAKEDPILIPLTWRIWIGIGLTLYILYGFVLLPLYTIITVDQKVFQEDLMFIIAGLLASGILIFACYRATKKEKGKNWLRWFRTRKN